MAALGAQEQLCLETHHFGLHADAITINASCRRILLPNNSSTWSLPTNINKCTCACHKRSLRVKTSHYFISQLLEPWRAIGRTRFWRSWWWHDCAHVVRSWLLLLHNVCSIVVCLCRSSVRWTRCRTWVVTDVMSLNTANIVIDIRFFLAS